MPPILDVAIGTVFVFLLFSLVVSALNEVILSYLDQRAKFLRMGLQELLGTSTAAPKSGFLRLVFSIGNLLRPDPTLFLWAPTVSVPNPNDLVQTLCSHGPINALSRSDKGNAPSYIPAGAFVTSLLDLLIKGTFNAPAAVPAAVAPAALPDLSTGTIPDELRAAINNLPAGRLKESLSSLLAVAGQDLGVFKTALEGWFNDAMDRVSGWYKRFAQNWMIVIGFVLAMILNVDTLRIVQTLSSNPNLAKAVANQAVAYSKNNNPTSDANDKDKDAQKAFQDSVAKLKDTGIPMGWDTAQLKALGLDGKEITLSLLWEKQNRIGPWLSGHRGQVFLLIAGWLLTAFAASLGAPFWFDMLGRIINIRNAGKAPNEKDPTASANTIDPKSMNATPHAPGAASGAPVITKQPADLNIKVGDAAKFSVVATGANLSYQWQKTTDAGTNDIPGATTNTYEIAAVALADNGSKFSCKITNLGGTMSSTAATLIVT